MNSKLALHSMSNAELIRMFSDPKQLTPLEIELLKRLGIYMDTFKNIGSIRNANKNTG
jgi:hypothetical protein